MSSASSLVDWDLAGRTARRLMSAGPSTTREEAAAVVRELHEAAAVAVAHVEKLTGLRPVADGPVPEDTGSAGSGAAGPASGGRCNCWWMPCRRSSSPRA